MRTKNELAACVAFVWFGFPNWICRGTEELTMKVGDLVRSTIHENIPYGIVFATHPDPEMEGFYRIFCNGSTFYVRSPHWEKVE
jgi:hypothetical protein